MTQQVSLEFLSEGGWETTVTQGTVITPAVVKTAMAQLEQFVKDFNVYLADRGQGTVKIGRPTGSATYHDRDPEDKVYGDIDVQMIADEQEGETIGQFNARWNALAADFIKTFRPNYVHDESRLGHPIIQLGNDQYVQVDFMWHPERLAAWGAARVTPEQGVKGLITGNLYSALGEVLNMSIQHAGVQFKTVQGQRVPFGKQKDTELKTISTDPQSFLLAIFQNEAKVQNTDNIKLSSELRSHPGVNPNNIRIADLVSGIRGLAQSFAASNMFGQGDLQQFQSAEQFLQIFWQRYVEKAEKDIASKKRDKAETPQARQRAEQDRQKVRQGLETVQALLFGK